MCYTFIEKASAGASLDSTNSAVGHRIPDETGCDYLSDSEVSLGSKSVCLGHAFSGKAIDKNIVHLSESEVSLGNMLVYLGHAFSEEGDGQKCVDFSRKNFDEGEPNLSEVPLAGLTDILTTNDLIASDLSSDIHCYPVNENEPFFTNKDNGSLIDSSELPLGSEDEVNLSDNNDCILENEDNIPSPISDMSCIKISEDKLYMRRDHLVQFIPADCKLTTETSQELINQNRFNYDDLKREMKENIQLGDVIVYKYDHQCVFNLIIKETFDSKPYIKYITDASMGLKLAMDELKYKTVSISRIGNGLIQIP